MQMKQWFVEDEAGAGDTGSAAGTDEGDAGKGADAGDAGSRASDAGASDDGASSGDAGAPAFTPESWRDYLAEGDEKARKRLERFQEPKDIWKMARELERKMSSGEVRSVAPKDNATAEELKAWRAENGIPEKPEDYKLELPGGKTLELEDDEAESYKPLLATAHSLGLRQEQVAAILQADQDRNELMAERQTNAEKALASTVAEELREEWGADFKVHQTMIKTNLERQSPELYEALMRGRMADGTPIGSNKEVLKWIVQNEREINPAAHLLPGSGTVTINTIQDELDSIKEVMRNDRPKYNKDEKMQARYRELLAAQEKVQARG